MRPDMRLKLTVPTGTLVDESVSRLTADGAHGSFTMLARHADTAVLLVPGLLSYVGSDQQETFVAVDHGVLVKTGDRIRVACQRAVVTGSLGDAETAVNQGLRRQDETETRARTALLRLESEILRRLGELRH